MSNLTRFKCENPECICDYYRGGANENTCPVCEKNNTRIVAFGVSE